MYNFRGKEVNDRQSPGLFFLTDACVIFCRSVCGEIWDIKNVNVFPFFVRGVFYFGIFCLGSVNFGIFLVDMSQGTDRVQGTGHRAG